mmetsp:Transcript_14427/g.56734  ORF Transcript_14427/g.56734 Transcript_14427/m.56734 type:complete len:688 (-) Transcript_14427:53-2116(-)
MASLTSLLPPPKRTHRPAISPLEMLNRARGVSSSTTTVAKAGPSSGGPPPYGRRQGFVPKCDEDYGDGGAFPEVHQLQYPYGMGEPGATKQNVLARALDSSGRVKFEGVVKKGEKKHVWSTGKDLVPVYDAEVIPRPSDEEVEETTEKTRKALMGLVEGKVQANKPSRPAEQRAEATFVRYTPAQSTTALQTDAPKQRVIKMIEIPIDPLEPPKFKAKKVARGPGSPPVPIMHSPPKKLSKEDHDAWNIPPCISNWKNKNGYTISLDKRLAADGRGLQKPQINDKFASFAESLYTAERKAREMVEKRQQIKQKLLENERRDKEEQLRRMAENARRGPMMAANEDDASDSDASDSDDEEAEEEYKQTMAAKQERDRLREERRRQTEREMRMENMKAGPGGRRRKDEDRDVSEKIALGQAVRSKGGEAMFDQRLFNQTQGISAGFASDDTYDVFEKPLFSGAGSSQLFRPKKTDEDLYGGDLEKLKDTSKFKPDRQFTGADPRQQSAAATARDGPVQFQRDQTAAADEEEDVFGFNEFLNEAKTGAKKLDQLGARGSLAASGAGTKDMYSSEAAGQRSVGFAAASGAPPPSADARRDLSRPSAREDSGRDSGRDSGHDSGRDSGRDYDDRRGDDRRGRRSDDRDHRDDRRRDDRRRDRDHERDRDLEDRRRDRYDEGERARGSPKRRRR